MYNIILYSQLSVFWHIHCAACRCNKFIWVAENYHYCMENHCASVYPPSDICFHFSPLQPVLQRTPLLGWCVHREHILAPQPAASCPWTCWWRGCRCYEGASSTSFELNSIMCKFLLNSELKVFMSLGLTVLSKHVLGFPSSLGKGSRSSSRGQWSGGCSELTHCSPAVGCLHVKATAGTVIVLVLSPVYWAPTMHQALL